MKMRHQVCLLVLVGRVYLDHFSRNTVRIWFSLGVPSISIIIDRIVDSKEGMNKSGAEQAIEKSD